MKNNLSLFVASLVCNYNNKLFSRIFLILPKEQLRPVFAARIIEKSNKLFAYTYK